MAWLELFTLAILPAFLLIDLVLPRPGARSLWSWRLREPP